MMERSAVQIGVLALQGDFAAHQRMLERVGAQAVEVRRPKELSNLEGLIIPGGESTTMLKFLTEEGLLEPIRQYAKSKPVFGTCAGAILLAREVTNPPQPSLNVLDISIARNAYGRQVDSFIGEVETALAGGAMEAVFIRAPRITALGEDVEVIATHQGEPVFVREGNIFAATFHPELTNDDRAHRLFLASMNS